MKYLILSFLFLFLQVANIFADELWNGAKYGMSLEETKAQFPKSFTPQKKSTLKSGAIELLRINNIEISDINFNTGFYFKNNKLDEVKLSYQENEHSFSFFLFDEITELLRAKYGKEISYKIKKGRVSNSASATWLSGKTNISLLQISTLSGLMFLNISYQQRISKDADKL